MGRIKLLALLLALPLMARAQFTYVGTSTVISPTVASYDVSVGNLIVVTIITSDGTVITNSITDSAGNVLTDYVDSNNIFAGNIAGAQWGGWLGGSTCPFAAENSATYGAYYYGIATHSGTGVTVTSPASNPGTASHNHIEAQIFSSTYTHVIADWTNGVLNWFSGSYAPSPYVTTPAQSNELWITAGYKLQVTATPTLTPSTYVPTATTALTAVGGTSWNYYSTPVGTQTFTYPANDVNTCSNPGSNNFDNYAILFQSMGFIGSNPPSGGTQPHVDTYIGQ